MEQNMSEMFTTEDQTLIEENQNVKQILISKNRLQERQLILEENDNICKKLQYDVEQKLLTNIAESQLSSNFNQKYQKTLNINLEFIENYNKIKDTIQLCLDDQNQFKICNRELSDKFNKHKIDSERENKNYLVKINHNAEASKQLNAKHEIIIRDFQLKINENEQLIVELDTEIKRLQNDGVEIKNIIESLTTKAKLLLEKHDTIFNEISALKETYETFITNSEDETNQLINELNQLKFSSNKYKDSIQNKTDEITVLQKAYENQNDFLNELKSKYDHLELSLLNYKEEKTNFDIKINDLKDINGQETVYYNCKIVEIEVQSNDLDEKNQFIVNENETLQQRVLSLQSKIDDLKIKMELENKEYEDCETNINDQNLIIEQNRNKCNEKVDELKLILQEKDSANLKLEEEFETVNNEVAIINGQIQSYQNENDEMLSTNKEKEINMNLTLDSIIGENKILKCSLKEFQNNNEELKLSENQILQRLNEEFQEELSSIIDKQNEIKIQCEDEEEELGRELNKRKEIFISTELQIIDLKTMKKNVEIELGLKIEEISKLDDLKAKQEEDRKKEQKLEELRIKQNKECKMKEQKRLEEQAIKKQNEVKKRLEEQKLKAKQNEEENEMIRLADLQNNKIKKQCELNLRKRKRLEDKTKQNEEENQNVEEDIEFNHSINQTEQELLNETINKEYDYKMKEYELKETAHKEFEKQAAKEKALKELEKQQIKEKAQKELERQLQSTGVQMNDLKDSITLIPKNLNPMFKKPISRYSSSSLDTSDSSFDDDYSIGKRSSRYKTLRQSKKQALSIESHQDLDVIFNSLINSPTPKKGHKRSVF